MSSCNNFTITNGTPGPIKSPYSFAAPRSVDYSEYVQSIKDKGTYRQLKDVLTSRPLSNTAPTFTIASCSTPFVPYPYVNTGAKYDPGVVWSHNFRYSFLRFRGNNVPLCTAIVKTNASGNSVSIPSSGFFSETPTKLTSVHVGNDTITSYSQ